MSFLLLGTLATAQDDPTPAKGPDQEQLAEAEAHLAELEADFDAAMTIWREEQQAAMKAAIDAGGPIPAMRMAPPSAWFQSHLPPFVNAAQRWQGTEGATGFHLWLLRHGALAEDKAVVQRSMMRIYSEHLSSPRMIELPEALAAASAYAPARRAQQMLKELERKTKYPSVRANAALARLTPDLKNYPVDSKEYATARRELDYNAKAKGVDPEIVARIQALIESIEGADGDLARDIAGVDMDGVNFKLSDYKGKVILLDFWGDW